ncbi:MAG: hypothetical protein GEV08_18485 [Acidimicrobiia bacterium]|nr:hypothetical protein [Acidimicrobiia bacterium]
MSTTEPRAADKPRPVPIEVTEPFWSGLRDEEVRLQRCDDCGAWVFYPRHRCPSCLSAALRWHTVSGRASVYTFTIARQATHPAFADEVPQVLAVVELEEGPRLTTTLVDVDPDEVCVGLAVLPVFDRDEDGTVLLRYRPAR